MSLMWGHQLVEHVIFQVKSKLLTASHFITIVSAVILSIAPVPIVDAPPIGAGEFPVVTRPGGCSGGVLSCGWHWN